jgi:uncharacterized membrane protein
VGNPIDDADQPEIDQDKVKKGLDAEFKQRGMADGHIAGLSPSTEIEDYVAHEEARNLNRRQRLREKGQRLRDTRQQVQEGRIAGKADEELAASDVLMGTKLRAYTSVARDALISPEKRNRIAASYPAYAAKKSLAAGKALWGGSPTRGDTKSRQGAGNVQLPLEEEAVKNAKNAHTARGNHVQEEENDEHRLNFEPKSDGSSSINPSGPGHGLGDPPSPPEETAPREGTPSHRGVGTHRDTARTP